jgi:hypothetical protein
MVLILEVYPRRAKARANQNKIGWTCFIAELTLYRTALVGFPETVLRRDPGSPSQDCFHLL